MAKMKKLQPAVQTMYFKTPPTEPGTPSTMYIDLSQCASILNRRFYRQGLQWAVGGIKFISSVESTVMVTKLPETWIMSNSWEKGFRAWQRMNKNATEETSVKPKFLDFKIYADADHHQAGVGANLLPLNVSDATYAVPGEWEYSKFVIPRAAPTSTEGQVTNREIIAVGQNYPGIAPGSGYDAVSLIEGYAASRGLPDIKDPNTPNDAADAAGTTPENWISALDNDGTEQDEKVLNDMITENNQAPYPFENDGIHTDTMYPGGANQMSGLQLHDFESVTATTIGGMSRIKGGMFPCGLIRIDYTNLSQQGGVEATFQLELVPGGHRGYLAEPMTEM